jgi:hypothetical protein
MQTANGMTGKATIPPREERVPRRPFWADNTWIYAGMFLAIAALQSIPRFAVELTRPLVLPQRVVLLAVFFGIVWFFTHAVHDRMHWDVLGRLFFIEAMLTATMAVFLIGQLAFPALTYVTLALIVGRAFLYAYVVSHRLPQLRGLVFATGAIVLVAGEFVILFGTLPF